MFCYRALCLWGIRGLGRLGRLLLVQSSHIMSRSSSYHIHITSISYSDHIQTIFRSYSDHIHINPRTRTSISTLTGHKGRYIIPRSDQKATRHRANESSATVDKHSMARWLSRNNQVCRAAHTRIPFSSFQGRNVKSTVGGYPTMHADLDLTLVMTDLVTDRLTLNPFGPTEQKRRRSRHSLITSGMDHGQVSHCSVSHCSVSHCHHCHQHHHPPSTITVTSKAGDQTTPINAPEMASGLGSVDDEPSPSVDPFLPLPPSRPQIINAMSRLYQPKEHTKNTYTGNV